MKFAELLDLAIQRSEIPLRFEPGAEDALAGPIVEVLKAWIESHEVETPRNDHDYGRMAVIQELMDELEGRREIKVE